MGDCHRVTFVDSTILFSYHPLFMILAFPLFMSEGILIGSFIKTSRRRLMLKLHLSFQLACSACAILGFSVIYYNKNLNNKLHFTTWHGLFGACSVVVTVVQTLFGLTLYYYPKKLSASIGVK